MNEGIKRFILEGNLIISKLQIQIQFSSDRETRADLPASLQQRSICPEIHDGTDKLVPEQQVHLHAPRCALRSTFHYHPQGHNHWLRSDKLHRRHPQMGHGTSADVAAVPGTRAKNLHARSL